MTINDSTQTAHVNHDTPSRRDSMLGELLVELSRERGRRARRRSRRAVAAITVMAMLIGAAATIATVRTSHRNRSASTEITRSTNDQPPPTHDRSPSIVTADIRIIATDPNVISRYASSSAPRITMLMDDSTLLTVLDRELAVPTGIARVGGEAQLTAVIDDLAGSPASSPVHPPWVPWPQPIRSGG